MNPVRARSRLTAVVLGIVALLGVAPAAAGQAANPQVRAILFYSPECPHCHDVMEEHLPPLLREHGAALRIVAVNVDRPEGQALYGAVARHFRLTRERLGVPALVVGDRILVGSWEIPARLPVLIREGLGRAGVDWPAIPEVRAFLSLAGIADAGVVELEGWMLGSGADAGPALRVLGAGGGPGSPGSVVERFGSDAAGNGIAVLVLIGMLVVLGLSARQVWSRGHRTAEWPAWAIPALAAAGTAIAAYMAFVEVTGTEAICGPVGDCNRVQLSPYASVAGIPVGLLGVGGYLLIGAMALTMRLRPRRGGPLPLLVWATAAAGVVFSIYLTFLEPFVIGATCLWCINSAVIMTLILIAATPAATRPGREGPRSKGNAVVSRAAGRAGTGSSRGR